MNISNIITSVSDYTTTSKEIQYKNQLVINKTTAHTTRSPNSRVMNNWNEVHGIENDANKRTKHPRI